MAAGQVTVPAGVKFERRQPARAPGREDVVVNWMYSLGSALVWTLAGVVAAVLIRQTWPIIAGICLGVASFVLLWFTLLFESRRLLWLMETVTGKDLDGDQQVGKPDPPVILRTPPNVRQAERPITFTTEDVSSPNRRLALDLMEFLTMGARERGFGIRDWTGKTLSSGTYVSDGVWREWTGSLKEAGILTDAGGKTGLSVDLDTALRCVR